MKTRKLKRKKTKVSKVDALKAQLVRALADYDNLEKRVARDRELITKRASINFLRDLLPFIDMLDKAAEHIEDSGLTLALSELEKVLELKGFEKIDPEIGSEFDQELHEVTDVVAGRVDETIAEVELIGWKLDETVVRHAKVKVYTNNE